MDIEVLALVVGLVLHVPDPVVHLGSFLCPQILVGDSFLKFVCGGPGRRNIIGIAATDHATLTPANPFHKTQMTLLVDVETNYPEIFGLN